MAGRPGRLRLRGRQVLVAERPASLRVEIQGLLNQTVAVLVTDGERFELFRADDRSYRSGPVEPDLLWRHAWLALTPQQAIDVLLRLVRKGKLGYFATYCAAVGALTLWGGLAGW